MQKVVTLGGREYTIKQKPMGTTAKWRRKLSESQVLLIFQSLDRVVAQFTAIATDVEKDGLAGIDIAQALGLTRILPVVVNGLLGSIDEVWELLFEYATPLADDREWLEENAYDEEGVKAFLVVLGLCFPISALWETVSGRKVQQTNTNSPTRNGTSGLPASGPVRKSAKTSS